MLTEVAAGIWEATQPLRVAGFDLGHRLTVIRLDDGEMVVHSPIKLSSPVIADLSALGPVKHILAPSAMHDLYLAEWMSAFPNAVLLHSPALKLGALDRTRCEPVGLRSLGGLDLIPIEGMPRIQEFAAFHPSSATLIVCDLVFNLPPGRGFQKLFQRLNGIYQRVGPSKFFRAFISHDEAFRASLQRILALPFDRLIVGHGANVATGAPVHLRRAFEWLRL